MALFKNLDHAKSVAWNVIKSPKTKAFLKLGVALIGVVQAVDELRKLSKKSEVDVNLPEED